MDDVTVHTGAHGHDDQVCPGLSFKSPERLTQFLCWLREAGYHCEAVGMDIRFLAAYPFAEINPLVRGWASGR